MELKDMVLATINEIEKMDESAIKEEEIAQKTPAKPLEITQTDEKIFLKNIQEKILVLFEGLQSPKNDNLDIKLDITLNFLEFLLSSIEERLQDKK